MPGVNTSMGVIMEGGGYLRMGDIGECISMGGVIIFAYIYKNMWMSIFFLNVYIYYIYLP